MRVVAPNRVTHTYRQQLVALPEKVFPLLCPVREVDWATGWDPRLVISASGVAERDCVFVTPGEPSDSIWYVTRHEPMKLYVEMLKVTPGLAVTRLDIQLHENGDGCLADVTYSFTSLGPEGDAFLSGLTAEWYRGFMAEWERTLNAYLAR